MSYALVGSLGTVLVSASAGSAQPGWGTGENRAAGNLLICWCNGSSVTLPAAPSGWSIAAQIASLGTTKGTTSIFYKIAAGADVAPTIAGITSTVLWAQVGEFSGNAASSPLDRSGTNPQSTATSYTATAGGIDAAAGELLVYASETKYSSVTVSTVTDTLNNGATANSTNNNGVSSANHYDFGYGITTGNSAADSSAYSVTVAPAASAVAVASFLLAAAAGSSFIPHRMPQGV